MSTTFNKSNEIHLADLIQALKTLNWQNDEQAAVIVRALGFTVSTQSQKSGQHRAIADQTRDPSPPKLSNRQSITDRKFSAPPAKRPPIDLPTGVLNSELKPLKESTTTTGPEPNWLEKKDSPQEKPSQLPAKLYRKPLITDNTSRGIFSAAVVTQRVGNEIDVYQLINQVVTGRIPKRIPRLSSGTLERGCQLLLHYSDNTVPYWEDMNTLEQQLQKVIGSDRISCYEFSDNPKEAKRWVSLEDADYWSPKKGIPIVVATDLDIWGSDSKELAKTKWRPFIDQCESAASPLVLLIPWPRRRWPEKELGAYPYLIHWSSHTSAAMIRRHIGKGHQVTS